MSADRIPFEPEDESAMASGATWARISAVVSVLSTVCGSVVALQAEARLEPVDFVVEAVTLIVTLVLAFWLFRAGTLFHRVATNDADQRVLVKGFLRLRAYFRLVVILAVAAVLVAAILLVLGELAP